MIVIDGNIEETAEDSGKVQKETAEDSGKVETEIVKKVEKSLRKIIL